MGSLIGGKFTVKIDSTTYYASGVFKYGGGFDKRENVMHSGGIAGYKTSPVAPFVSGELIDTDGLSMSDIAKIEDATITIDLANKKQIILRHAWSCNDNGLENDSDGKLVVKFEGLSMEIVPSLE